MDFAWFIKPFWRPEVGEACCCDPNDRKEEESRTYAPLTTMEGALAEQRATLTLAPAPRFVPFPGSKSRESTVEESSPVFALSAADIREESSALANGFAGVVAEARRTLTGSDIPDVVAEVAAEVTAKEPGEQAGQQGVAVPSAISELKKRSSWTKVRAKVIPRRGSFHALPSMGDLEQFSTYCEAERRMVRKNLPPKIDQVDDEDKTKQQMSSILDLGRGEYHDVSHLAPAEQHRLAQESLEAASSANLRFVKAAGFDGTWSSPQCLRHVTSGSIMTTGAEFVVLNADTCEWIENGSACRGALDGNTISWDNGDVWRRNSLADFRAAADVDCQFTAAARMHDFTSFRRMRSSSSCA